MRRRYAQDTTVSSDKSRAEIERILVRYGAYGFLYGWQDDRAVVGFTMEARQVKFLVPLPSRDEMALTPTGKERAPAAAREAYEKAVRQKWRALALVIKAKLEAIESQISTFDEEFMAWVVLPDGSTVGQVMGPQIHSAYESGRMPKLLTDGRPRRARKS